jgi:hypothetical protein
LPRQGESRACSRVRTDGEPPRDEQAIGHNPAVKFSRHSSRWALWVLAAALLLKSAMPFLADAAAQAQGKTLVEVCTVYGVSLVPSAGDDRQPPSPDHAGEHRGEHCALTALTALATAEPAVFRPVAAVRRGVQPPSAHPSSGAPDACAAWIAQLRHGPPSIA